MIRFSKFIQEAKLSVSQRDRLDDLILNVHMTTHPEYDGEEEPTKYLNMIRKEFGDKVAKQVSDGIDKMHWGRDNRSGGYDKLAFRKGNARITKSGKMNAQDVQALKNKIKRDKAWGGITKAVKLPEALELDEKLKASDKMGDWVKDFQDSDAPQFKGKSQKKRQQMAVAAKLGAERDAGMREEVDADFRNASESNDLKQAFIASMQKKLKNPGSLRDPNAKTARGEDKLAKQLAAKAKMKEEVELDEQTQYDLVEAYLLENNIDVDALSVEQLDEIIGKVIGGAFKVGAKAAVGAARRMSTAGRADAAEKRAAAAEKRNKDRERIETARQRLRDAQKAAREAKSGATT